MGRTVSAFAVLLLIATAMSAQVSGRLTGTVIDAAGASVPGAKVALYLSGGKTPLLTTTTNSEGIFDFVGVRSDLYRLEIDSPGFNKLTRQDVKVDPARQLLLPPITLTVASATQSVEV